MKPKLTYDFKEYLRRIGHSPMDMPTGIFGLYKEGWIWSRTANPVTILHEFLHWFLQLPSSSRNGSIVLFFGGLESLLDFCHGFLFHKPWRTGIHQAIKRVRYEWKDFLTFYFCWDENEDTSQAVDCSDI